MLRAVSPKTAVLVDKVFGVGLDVIEHGSQILEIYQQEIIIIRDPVYDTQNIALQVIELQNPGHQKGTHLGDSRAQGHSHFAVDIPQSYGEALIIESVLSESEPCDPLLHIGVILTGEHKSRQISLDIRHKYRDTHLAERLSHNACRHSLAGSGRSGDQTMSVCHAGQQEDSLSCIVVRHPDFVVTKHFYPPQLIDLKLFWIFGS